MIWSTISLIYPVLILTAAICCYKKDGRLMRAFYLRMAYHDVTRRFYVLAVMVLLLLFLFFQTRCRVNVIETFLPLSFSAVLIRHQLAELLFYFLKKRKVMITTHTLILVALFTPHLFPMAVTLGILLTAAIFYPSKEVRSMVESTTPLHLLLFDHSEIIRKYY
jgi:hypothetical protein